MHPSWHTHVYSQGDVHVVLLMTYSVRNSLENQEHHNDAALRECAIPQVKDLAEQQPEQVRHDKTKITSPSASNQTVSQREHSN